MSDKRVVCLNCIDGRTQLPVINWIKEDSGADYVDMITEPGMDFFLANQDNVVDDVIRKINISIEKNSSSTIFLVGHHDCQANSVSEDEHKKHIALAVDRIEKKFEIPVQGLWVNAQWQVEKVNKG
jgi:carbonic anhydrase